MLETKMLGKRKVHVFFQRRYMEKKRALAANLDLNFTVSGLMQHPKKYAASNHVKDMHRRTEKHVEIQRHIGKDVITTLQLVIAGTTSSCRM